VAGGALGWRDLASGCDRADLRCSWSAGLLFDVLDRRRSRLDRYLFRLDLAGGPRRDNARLAA